MGKKITFITIFLVFMVIGGYFLYNHFFLGNPVQNIGLTKNLETKFETGIFTNQKFIDLKDHLGTPVVAGEKGKINPFMKF